jgi:hypothetical protein
MGLNRSRGRFLRSQHGQHGSARERPVLKMRGQQPLAQVRSILMTDEAISPLRRAHAREQCFGRKLRAGLADTALDRFDESARAERLRQVSSATCLQCGRARLFAIRTSNEDHGKRVP